MRCRCGPKKQNQTKQKTKQCVFRLFFRVQFLDNEEIRLFLNNYRFTFAVFKSHCSLFLLLLPEVCVCVCVCVCEREREREREREKEGGRGKTFLQISCILQQEMVNCISTVC